MPTRAQVLETRFVERPRSGTRRGGNGRAGGQRGSDRGFRCPARVCVIASAIELGKIAPPARRIAEGPVRLGETLENFPCRPAIVLGREVVAIGVKASGQRFVGAVDVARGG